MKSLGKKPEEASSKEDSERDVEEKDGNQDSEKSAAPALPPVSFLQLFR
jgi:hypothetical protein